MKKILAIALIATLLNLITGCENDPKSFTTTQVNNTVKIELVGTIGHNAIYKISVDSSIVLYSIYEYNGASSMVKLK